jgi:signal transduction histidine kinase
MQSDRIEVNKPLSRILSSSQRMGRMIEQLLDVTRVRVGDGIPLAPSRIDATPIARQILDEIEDAYPFWTLRMRCTGDTTGTWDGDRLGQVFSNLVGNAVQHGAAGFPVEVVLDGTAPDRLSIEVQNMGAIPADVLRHLFEPLGRRARPSERSRGLGLGLFISREIVKAHGGTIEVRSAAGAGTTFSITLPR